MFLHSNCCSVRPICRILRDVNRKHVGKINVSDRQSFLEKNLKAAQKEANEEREQMPHDASIDDFEAAV